MGNTSLHQTALNQGVIKHNQSNQNELTLGYNAQLSNQGGSQHFANVVPNAFSFGLQDGHKHAAQSIKSMISNDQMTSNESMYNKLINIPGESSGNNSKKTKSEILKNLLEIQQSTKDQAQESGIREYDDSIAGQLQKMNRYANDDFQITSKDNVKYYNQDQSNKFTNLNNMMTHLHQRPQDMQNKSMMNGFSTQQNQQQSNPTQMNMNTENMYNQQF